MLSKHIYAMLRTTVISLFVLICACTLIYLQQRFYEYFLKQTELFLKQALQSLVNGLKSELTLCVVAISKEYQVVSSRSNITKGQ